MKHGLGKDTHLFGMEDLCKEIMQLPRVSCRFSSPDSVRTVELLHSPGGLGRIHVMQSGLSLSNHPSSLIWLAVLGWGVVG